MAELSITAANVIAGASAQKQTRTAGAAIAAGQLVYKDSAGEMQLSDANGAAAAKAVEGIALNSAADGQPLTYATQDDDLTLGTGTSGVPYFLSSTPGGIADAVPATSQAISVGIGIGSNKINFKITPGGALA